MKLPAQNVGMRAATGIFLSDQQLIVMLGRRQVRFKLAAPGLQCMRLALRQYHDIAGLQGQRAVPGQRQLRLSGHDYVIRRYPLEHRRYRQLPRRTEVAANLQRSAHRIQREQAT